MGKALVINNGDRFTRLTVQSVRPGSHNKPRRVVCKCDCGSIKEVALTHLTRGKIRSCGCLLAETKTTHGHSRSKVYGAWHRMHYRCKNPRFKQYSDYGGRGITIDPAWESFETFLADMGEQPSGMSLERIDNNLGYSKLNCKWATSLEQQNNTRQNVFVSFDGRKQSIARWAAERKISTATLGYRLRHGWSAERALTETPVYNKKASQCVERNGP